MTTVAMIFGMIPLALAIGEGAEQRAPMARAVIGGLITSTLLTLFVVPVMYTLLDDLGGAGWRRGSRAAAAPAGTTRSRGGSRRPPRAIERRVRAATTPRHPRRGFA